VTPRLALVAGATWGRAGRDYTSVAVPGVSNSFNLKARKTYASIAPRAGLLWEDERGVQVFANLTRSAEPPNFASMSPTNTGFAPIAAQTAWTAEAGARGRRGPFTFEVTLYRAQLHKELLQYQVTPSVPATTFNAGRTLHQGVEAALDWRLSSSLRLRQTYTYSDFRFQNDAQYGDNRLPVAPRSLYRAELRYQHPSGWFVAPSMEASPSGVWVDFTNTAKAPGYAVFNLNAGWTLNQKLTLFVDVRNLADKTYVSNVQPAINAQLAPGVGYYWPGDGRAVFGGVSVAF